MAIAPIALIEVLISLDRPRDAIVKLARISVIVNMNEGGLRRDLASTVDLPVAAACTALARVNPA